MGAHEYDWDQEAYDSVNDQDYLDTLMANIEAGFFDAHLVTVGRALAQRYDLVKVFGPRTEDTMYDDDGNIIRDFTPTVPSAGPVGIVRPMRGRRPRGSLDTAAQDALAAAVAADPDMKYVGTYVAPDGAYYRVSKTQQNKQLIVKRLVITKDAVKNRAGKVIEPADHNWEYLGKFSHVMPLKTLQDNPAWKLTVDQAKQAGLLFGMCVRCGKKFTREESIERGIGPVCIQNILAERSV